jgi:hypothetical protein
MSDPTQKPPREPTRDRLRRLGLKNTPGPDPTRQVFRGRRYYREQDENILGRLNTPDTNKTK